MTKIRPSADLLKERILNAGFVRAMSGGNVSGEYIVYCVTNGPNILAVGQGRAGRLQGLLPKSACRKHTKSFIVAAAQSVLVKENEFYFVRMESQVAAKALEASLHTDFGETYFESLGSNRSNLEISRWLWGSLKARETVISERLDAVMSLVCYDGDILTSLFRIDEFKSEVNRMLRFYYRV